MVSRSFPTRDPALTRYDRPLERASRAWASAKCGHPIQAIPLPSSKCQPASGRLGYRNAPALTPASVIAIHGLGTESPRTWVFKKKDGCKVNWLADPTMLPAAVPEATIFTYDWNANYFEDAPVQTLLGHADALLAHAKENQSSSKRPIIFVASCFGGLVLAEALTRAAQEGSPYRQVLLSTAGIVFLATPFQGADARKEAQWQVIIGGIMGEDTSDRLVHDLDREHDFVLQRVQKFAEVINADSIRLPVHCFYETKKTEILRRVLSSGLAAKLSTRFTHKIVRLSL